MASVLGIGGVFIKSKDADALRAWYREMLGFEIQEWGGAQFWSTARLVLYVALPALIASWLASCLAAVLFLVYLGCILDCGADGRDCSYPGGEAA